MDKYWIVAYTFMRANHTALEAGAKSYTEYDNEADASMQFSFLCADRNVTDVIMALVIKHEQS